MESESTKVSNYFENHGITADFYNNYNIPHYLLSELPLDKESAILDVGPGFGQFLVKLKELGYKNCEGIEFFDPAIEHCHKKNLNVIKTDGSWNELINAGKKYDLITLSHVLEHIPKREIINNLKKLREVLNPNGKIVIMVPNGQAATGCYWAYEDFTHTTLFTAGSLIYVLKEAGFKDVSIIDPYAISGASIVKKIIRTYCWIVYDLYMRFISKMLDSSFHKPSPRVYSFEVKAKGFK